MDHVQYMPGTPVVQYMTKERFIHFMIAVCALEGDQVSKETAAARWEDLLTDGNVRKSLNLMTGEVSLLMHVGKRQRALIENMYV